LGPAFLIIEAKRNQDEKILPFGDAGGTGPAPDITNQSQGAGQGGPICKRH
jgi:hypothetical protein